MPHATFLEKLHRRTAQAAIGPSALRNQGAAGVIGAARRAAESIDLTRYSMATLESIATLLNEDTSRILLLFPASAQSWGAARKGLNLFLRDAAYNVDLNNEFKLAGVRSLLEVPLDKDVGTALNAEPEGANLPRWRSIKSLQPAMSTRYQDIALQVARRFGVSRVDLDVYFWRPR